MQALQYIEIDLDHCQLTYSVAPCQASLTNSPPTGTFKCFNTLGTCQDRANFTTEIVTYRFAVPTLYLPNTIDAIPSIKSISFDSAQVSLGANLGSRATITITFEDHKHSDTGIDKYLTDRTYDPYKQGTFFGKFRARFPFVRGRSLRWINGAVGQTLAQMETRHYIIDSYSGPTNSGEYVIIAKDILKLADGDRALAPAANTGRLAADITNVALTATVQPAGVGAEYGSGGYVTIGGSEIASYIAQSGYDPPNSPNDGPVAVSVAGGTELETTGIIGGSSDSKQLTMSFWIKPHATGLQYIWAGGTAPSTTNSWVRINTVLEVLFTNAAGTTILALNTTTLPPLDRWTHVLIAFDLSNPTSRQIYINDVLDMTVVTFTNDTVDFTRIYALFSVIAFANEFNGQCADFWMAPGVYLDLSVVANRRKFISAAKRPVRLGPAGQTPTGTSPLVFLANPLASWQTNLGTGASFSVIGTALVAGTFATGDTLQLTARGQLGTTAAAHSTDDRVQEILQYVDEDPADIIADLLQTYAGIDPSFIPIADWLSETQTYLARTYTGTVATPVAVADLIAELIEQAGLALWWDDLNQEVGLLVLRGFITGSTFTQDTIIEGSLEISEQPDKRLSQVQTYFGQINPTQNLTEKNNYKLIEITTDAAAESDYGSAAIKEIFSRWIPVGGRPTATRLNGLLLSRYRDPPRHFKFQLMRGSVEIPQLARSYRLNAWPLQDSQGSLASLGFQVTRLRPLADIIEVEADEILFTATAQDLTSRTVIYDLSVNNANAKTQHDAIYPAASSGDHVSIIVNPGIVIGSVSDATPAFNVGTWPAGVSISLEVNGTIQGHGGNGGDDAGGGGQPGHQGGTALFTRKAITLTDTSGKLWAGGGGGGGASGQSGGGGGGAGTLGGVGGAGFGWISGNDGTATSGGAGVTPAPAGGGANSGNGGNIGLAGSAAAIGGAGGAAGNAIDGLSFVTTIGTAGDRRGGQVN